jgi:hypothetical protein
LIKEELRRFDADRTGMPDFALESSGFLVEKILGIKKLKMALKILTNNI